MTASASCAIYLITYDRGKDHRGHTKPYHWEFLVELGRPGSLHGVAHQLHGMPGAFYYSGPEPVPDNDHEYEHDHDNDMYSDNGIWASSAPNAPRAMSLRKNTLEIGCVPREEVDGGALEEVDGGALEALLRAIPIVCDEASEWNCQSWAGEAIARFVEKGWVDARYSFAVVKEWMKEQ